MSLVVSAIGCHTSGEHQSITAVCDVQAIDPALVTRLHDELRRRLARDGFAACSRKAKRPFQRGAQPIETYCGELGSVEVLALINRPGERDCALELDLRADVAGSEQEIAGLELPIIEYRNVVRDWFKAELAGTNASVQAAGAWLGDESLLPAH